MYPDSRPRQGFYEGYGGFGRQGMGPYAPPSHQGDSAGYQVHSSFTASLSERSGKQQKQGSLAHPPHPHAGLASGWPMHEAGSTHAVQSWDGAETSEAHKLLQELADAQAAERDYLVCSHPSLVTRMFFGWVNRKEHALLCPWPSGVMLYSATTQRAALP